MHGLEQIVAMNAQAGTSTSVDLTAFAPWGVKMNPLNGDQLGYSVTLDGAVVKDKAGQDVVFATYDQAVADMIARHAGHEDPKHLGFAGMSAAELATAHG